VKCANADCDHPTSGKSKYCLIHKREARARWKESIAASSEERKLAYAEYERVWRMAVEAGHDAAEGTTPDPMVVVRRADPLDDTSPVLRRWVVNDGACGFAWLRTKGNTRFANWAKKNAGWRKGYEGVTYGVSHFNQSYEKKMAFAEAAAQVLREHGIKVYAGGRED